ncbi:uncharacterized protein LOC122503331 isoform X2 [Leptopilina heterotoma]|uniref:uncharacterized protein LOC122503331 isoform X2 n=1 Tax=Leptopilina heterotoma TaxID=63436 RepID=UPI001CA9EF64|nr:uncharacterized protein LOC122503331 isoform X2 [Leptopilina heterotoma]
MMSNIDCRGVKRGSCSCGECDEYVLQAGVASTMTCAYCGCYPTKHRKLDQNTSNDNSRSNLDISAKDIRQAEVEIIFFEDSKEGEERTNEKKDESTAADTQNEYQSNSSIKSEEEYYENDHSSFPEEIPRQMISIEDIIPYNLNDDYHDDIMGEAFQSREIEKVKYCRIVRLIANKLIDARRTTSCDILQAAIIASNRFPGLQGKNGIPHRRLEMRLKNFFKNKRRRTKSGTNVNEGKNMNEDSSDFEEQTLEMILEILAKESGKTPIDVSKMKKLLEKTRKQRAREAKAETVKQMLKKYPILMETEILLWEFGQIVNLSETLMKQNLVNALPKLLAILPKDNDDSSNGIKFLKKIDCFFAAGKKKSTRRKIVEILKESDKQSISADPKTSKAPYIVIFEDNTETIRCYVDDEPLFVEKPTDIILLLLATYWVFNIEFDKDFRHQLILLCVIVFGKHAQRILGVQGIESITVNNILTKAGL